MTEAYERFRYDQVMIYEFLLPLTREDKLRRALDDLFYRDKVEPKLAALNHSQLEILFRRMEGEPDDYYHARLIGFISDHFSGYSITHVAGRYRAAALASRQEAARLLEANEPYLVDETSAVVRFIVPITATHAPSDPNKDWVEPNRPNQINLAAVNEMNLVHWLFFSLFVEAVVSSVDEDEIWLIEEAGVSRKLYSWKRRGETM